MFSYHDSSNFTLRIGLALVLGASVTGCAVGPGYHRPTVNLQPFHNAPSIEARTATLPAAPLDQWWTGFHDPVLTRIVKRALDENLDLAAAMARVQQARAAARGAGAQRLPSGNLSASTTTLYQSTESTTGRLATHLPGYSRSQNYYDLGFTASWETDLFGGLKRGAEAATAEAQVAEARQTGTRITVAAEAADAYLQIRGAQARLNFAKDQIATDQHLVELVQQRKDAGVASDRELAQAEAVLSQAKATIPLITVSLEAQLNRLDVLLGGQPGTYAAELTPVADIPDVPEISGFGTPTDLLRRRPDVIAAEREVAASNARIGQALAEYYPKLSLSSIVGSEAVAPAHLFEQQGFQPVSVVGLRWRLFDFGTVAAEVKEARGANAEALIQYRSSVLHAAEDVEDAFSLLVQSENRRNEILREIAELQRVHDRSEESYAAGAHFAVRAQFPVSARMMRIVDAANAQLALTSLLWDCLPAAAGYGAMDRTELVAAESHGILLISRKGHRWIFLGGRIVGKGNTVGLIILGAIWAGGGQVRNGLTDLLFRKPPISRSLSAHGALRTRWTLRRNRLEKAMPDQHI